MRIFVDNIYSALYYLICTKIFKKLENYINRSYMHIHV